MAAFNFITVRLGKDSIPDIKQICASDVGILSTSFTICVKCTQVPDNYGHGDYAFLWLGSDNNKGMPTDWKQGFKAVGRVTKVSRGKNYNDTSETTIEIVYIFKESVNRMDILRCAPTAYYWCSSMPLIGLDDHANQTIRNMASTAFADLRAFFSAIDAVTNNFKNHILQIEPGFEQYFDYTLPNPQLFPNAKNLTEIDSEKQILKPISSLQQIFYGAPGTGKSHKIKDDANVKAADEKNLVFRTTFHPDSDYSTFVGCYKPTKAISKRLQRMNLSLEDLARELGSYYSSEEFGKIGGIQKFCFEYYPYIDGEYMSVNVTKLLELAGIPKDYNVEINKYIKFCHLLPKQDPDKITYAFVPQAFTNAYMKAWNTDENVYLIIEEINRGNCAQIFGDLFQLLDRKNGVSEYPVEADTDLQNYLQKALADTTRTDIPDEVKSGKKLMLPSNLYIWATMNTSDQSLFPIDSAFKRRWEWKYIKIKEGRDENGNKLDWKVNVKMDESGTLLSWWDFIKKINEIIASMTSSADKQLGYFFCCAKDGVIDEEAFVSKVIFYLWNDVFKDYGFEDASLFRYTTKGEDGKDMEKDLTFPDFYDEEGENVNTERLTDFVKKVMGWKKTNAEQD